MVSVSNSQAPNLHFYHADPNKPEVEWITYPQSNLIYFTGVGDGYIIGKNPDNTQVQEYTQFDKCGKFDQKYVSL